MTTTHITTVAMITITTEIPMSARTAAIMIPVCLLHTLILRLIYALPPLLIIYMCYAEG